jgi:hypothetical protein
MNDQNKVILHGAEDEHIGNKPEPVATFEADGNPSGEGLYSCP